MKRLQPRLDIILRLQQVAERLLSDVDAMRTNVRIQTTNDHNYPVLAEALADGAFSLTGGMSLLGYQGADIHDAPTVRLMRSTGVTIVQRDTKVDPPLVPIAREFAGQAGQMLAPVHYAGKFCGFVAVHGDGEPRAWNEDEQRVLAEAVSDVEEILEAAPWFDRPDPAPLKHLLLVLSDPVEGREDEYNEWYSGRHIEETLATPGWSAARRFVRSPDQLSEHLPSQQYLALYEIACDDVAEAITQLRERSGAMTTSTSIAEDDLVAVFTPITDRIEST